ncbi:MAG TPA: hypothetical protein VGL47_43245 [Amycolatopsis sp.]|uniref:Uncharacterized protein n=1 Tax=Amycolatopsis nalaikhensis TaxID=715472 RepID=A0ABY8XI33_9PSEU|nr:hypothetical protein [Amycolatopsis sp. 2-2]WIV55271.1 hypothetical protein QP939_41650 [Amycolatopsis sp. 2-2]
MKEFEKTLRGRVGVVYTELAAAREGGEDYACDLHAARLEELFDLARRHGIDATTWVDLDVAIPRQCSA